MRQQIICGQCKQQVDECCKDQFRCERWLTAAPYQDKGGFVEIDEMYVGGKEGET